MHLRLAMPLAIAALAIGATEGYIYLRSEYPHAERTLNRAIEIAYQESYLGEDIRGSGKTFRLEVRRGTIDPRPIIRGSGGTGSMADTVLASQSTSDSST